MSNRRHILVGSSTVLMIRVAGAGLAMGAQILIARAIGRDQFGVYTYALSVITMLATLSRLGIDNALPRLLPVMLHSDRPRDYRGTLRLAFGLPLMLTAVSGMALLAYLALSASARDSDYTGAVMLMLIALPAFTLAFVSRSAMISIRRVLWGELPDMIIRPILLVTGVAIVYATVQDPDARTIAWVFIAAVTLSLGLGLYKLWRAQPDLPVHDKPTYPAGEAMRVALPMLVMTGFLIFIGEFTVILLGYFQPPEEVAIYGAALRLSLLVGFALTAVNTVLNPVISQLFHAEKFDELQVSLKHAAWWSLFPSAVAVAGIVLLGKPVLHLFGPGFDQGYPVLLVLLGGQAVNALTGPVGSMLKMCNKQNHACAAMLFAAVVNIVGCVVLIPRYGALGAGISVSISYAVSNSLMLVYTLFKIGLNPTVFPLPTRRRVVDAGP